MILHVTCNCLHFSIRARRPCTGAMLIFSVIAPSSTHAPLRKSTAHCFWPVRAPNLPTKILRTKIA